MQEVFAIYVTCQETVYCTGLAHDMFSSTLFPNESKGALGIYSFCSE